MQALVPAFALRPRNPHQRNGKIAQQIPLRSLTEYVQAVANLHLLQFTQPGIKSHQLFFVALRIGKTRVFTESRIREQIENLLSEQSQTPWIAARRLVIFVDQRFEITQCAVAFRAGQRRRQMVNNHRGTAPLRLRALARIVDDERIEMRRRSEHRFRKTVLRQGERLARQPFQIAVFSHMHDRMRTEFATQPRIEGEISVRRHKVRRMIAFLRIDIVSARRLNPDREFAVAANGQGETAVLFVEKRVTLRITPLILNLLLNGFRQAIQKTAIFFYRKNFTDYTVVPCRVRRTGQQMVKQRFAVVWHSCCVIAPSRKFANYVDRTRRRIETDAIADTSITIGIIGEHQRHPTVAGFRLAQSHPVCGEFRNEVDPVPHGAMTDHVRLYAFIIFTCMFECDGTREHPAIHFGQGDMHGEIATRKSLR